MFSGEESYGLRDVRGGGGGGVAEGSRVASLTGGLFLLFAGVMWFGSIWFGLV